MYLLCSGVIADLVARPQKPVPQNATPRHRAAGWRLRKKPSIGVLSRMWSLLRQRDRKGGDRG